MLPTFFALATTTLLSSPSKALQQPSLTHASTRRLAAAAVEHSASSSPLLTVFYNDVYHVPLPPRHRFPMAKYGHVRRRVQAAIEDEHNCPFFVSPLASRSELETTHCPDYIHRFLTGAHMTDEEIRAIGFPWSHAGVQRAQSSTGGTIAAARAALTSSGWAAHVAGGTHHALYDHGEGFCVFSDMAVAANVVRQEFASSLRHKILLLDLDVHQGNGNAVLFRDDPGVFTFSLQCAANYFSRKEASDLDIELPAGCTDATYLATLQHWLKRLKNEAGPFDMIFYQAGVDILECDRLGRMNISPAGVRRRDQMVFEFCTQLGVPTVITMGGGYPKSDANWEPIIEAHANVYIEAFRHRKKWAESFSASNLLQEDATPRK